MVKFYRSPYAGSYSTFQLSTQQADRAGLGNPNPNPNPNMHRSIIFLDWGRLRHEGFLFYFYYFIYAPRDAWCQKMTTMLPTCDSGSGSGSAAITTTTTSPSSQLLAIVTGGQTGVDRAVMQVALSHGVLHLKRSFCPRNYWAEDEQIPAAYHAYFTPTASADPAERTRRNVEASQATLIISTRKTLPPTTLTAVRHAKGVKQPHKHICSLTYKNDALAAARDAAAYLPVPLQCLHVGGPRASEDPQAHDWATQVLTHLIPLLIEAQTMPRRDALVPYLKQSRPCMAHVKQKLLEDGYCIVPSVLSKEECDAEMDRLWEYIATRSPAVRRDDASTWYPAEDGDDDPWPHTGWK